ncbi:MAG: glycosyltransferase family 4 protein [Sphingobacteriaceae bacterium]|nr:glycosyltransferase family 4 protein [Sphingobacteriaceae bacterium]
MKKILFIDNTAHHLLGQLHLMNGFKAHGFNVECLVPDDGDYFVKINELGFKCHSIQLDGKSRSIFKNHALIRKYNHEFFKIKPSLICSFTIKPNLYGAMAARSHKIPFIAGVTGLGTAFMKKNLLNSIVVRLYQFAFKDVNCVFFQNNDDRQTLEHKKIIHKRTLSIALPGDGVDLQKFQYVEKLQTQNYQFVYAGRIIADKGIYELIEAFRVVKSKYANSKLILIGNYFPGNHSAIYESEVNQWVDEGLIEYHGMVDNVEEYITNSDSVVLASYREGLPRVLLEASSIGRVIITVDSIGCKDVVEDGVTGYMAKVKDVDSLAQAMIKFIELPHDEKVKMGKAGRLKMEREFDQKIVINKYLEVANQLLHAKE